MAVFSNVCDLIRDRDLGGFAIAVWLVLLSFVSALIYLIERGKGTGERQMQTVQRMQDYETQRIRSVAGVSSADEISKATALYESGVITAEEYGR